MIKSIVLASLFLSALSVSAQADVVAKKEVEAKEISDQNVAGPAVVKVDEKKWVLQRTFGVIKPSGMSKISEIKSIIAAYGLEMRYPKNGTASIDEVPFKVQNGWNVSYVTAGR